VTTEQTLSQSSRLSGSRTIAFGSWKATEETKFKLEESKRVLILSRIGHMILMSEKQQDKELKLDNQKVVW